ncbi:hypothetical protein AS593_06880 [Caulobacter vibrioides]|nr:hypothetical protein AS593_06880 [Caulobacter vibrioides]
MNKTPLSKPYALQLNEINNQLCFAALVNEEACKVIRPGHAHPEKADTTTLFPGNSHASRIHRWAKDLAEVEVRAVSTSCRSALIAASEYVQIYCEEALKLVGSVSAIPHDPPAGGADEKLRAQLKAAGAPVIDGVFDTVIYLRRRRNNLVHANGSFRADFEKHFPAGAERLTAFWAKRPTELGGFDFANRRIEVFTVEDGYAVMNLFRICLSEIDGWVAGLLPLPHVVETIVKALLVRAPGLGGDLPRLVRKTRAVLELDYSERLDAATLGPMVQAAV